MLKKDVLPWLRELGPYLFQQDEASAHTAKEMQDWCRENFFDFLRKDEWPPSSPDCNPMNFFVWGITQRVVNKVPYKSVEDLKAAITKAWDDFDEEVIRTKCKRKFEQWSKKRRAHRKVLNKS